jgi:hypothetical protein
MDNKGHLFSEIPGHLVKVFAFPDCRRQSGRAPRYPDITWRDFALGSLYF